MKFNEAGLTQSLERLSPPLRVVFAATCAQRLEAGYEDYVQRVGTKWLIATEKVLSECMDELWEAASGTRVARPKIRRLIQRCIKLVPTQDEYVPAWHKHVEGAASATAYALSAIVTRTPKDAALAARVTYETAYSVISESIDVNPRTRDVERRILVDPLVQAELNRQRRDLGELVAATIGGANTEKLAADKREQARHESLLLP